jgi:hypothetical protein
MEQNKTSKYFKYAIGEIVLVVIGILIALQINNWNENRKQNIEIKTFLKEIAKNIKQDLIALTQQKIRRDSLRSYNRKVRENYLLKINNIEDFKKAEGFFYEFYFTSNKSGFDSFKNSGLIGKIKNSKIDSLIYIYYDKVEAIRNKEISYNTFIENVEFKFKTDFPVTDYMFLLNSKQIDSIYGTHLIDEENKLLTYFHSKPFQAGVIRTSREGTRSYQELIDIGNEYLEEIKKIDND